MTGHGVKQKLLNRLAAIAPSSTLSMRHVMERGRRKRVLHIDGPAADAEVILHSIPDCGMAVEERARLADGTHTLTLGPAPPKSPPRIRHPMEQRQISEPTRGVCHCGAEVTDLDAGWESRECVPCHRRSVAASETAMIVEAVEALASKHGWTVGAWDIGLRVSRYIDLARGDQTVRVRVSDHLTAHENEDISLVVPSAKRQDHSLAQLEKLLE